jgi:hypothetical protein
VGYELNVLIFSRRISAILSRAEAGSITSTLALLVVEGDEKEPCA